MAQATAITPSKINVCALRATRLNEDGTVAAGPHNAFISDKLVSLAMAPVVQAGDTKVLEGGCDQDIATWATKPKFRGWTLTLSKGALEPALEEMMTGGAVILDDSTAPVPIGLQWPETGSSPDPIALEVWSKLVLNDHAPGAVDTGITGRTYPYLRYLFPYTMWSPDNNTLDADIQPVGLTAECRGNASWGLGPWGDQPVSSNAQGFYVYDDFIPTAAPGYLTATSA